MNDKSLVKQHNKQVERVMSQGSSQFKSPRNVAQDIMTRAVDRKTGKVYRGESGLRLLDRQRRGGQ